MLQDGTLASGSFDKTIRLWDTKTGQSTKVLNGHTNWVFSLTVNTIRLWDTFTSLSLKIWPLLNIKINFILTCILLYLLNFLSEKT